MSSSARVVLVTCGIYSPTPIWSYRVPITFPPSPYPNHEGLQSATLSLSPPCVHGHVSHPESGEQHVVLLTQPLLIEFQSNFPPNPYPPEVTKYSSLTFHHLVFMAMVPIQSRVSNSWQLTWAIKFWSSAITARSRAVRWPNDSSSFTSRVCDRASFSS